MGYDQDYVSFCYIPWHGPTTSGGYIGLAVCVSLVGNGACEKHEVRIDTSFENTTDQNGVNVVGCHEVGHAVGLAHRGSGTTENGCMATPWPHAGELTNHDVTHINGGPWAVGPASSTTSSATAAP